MADTASIRLKNLLSVLKEIELEGEATAATLAESTELSVATISRVLAILKSHKLVTQLGKQTTELGRKPDVFRINSAYGYYLYFYIESARMKGYLLNLTGGVIAKGTVGIAPRVTVEEFTTLLLQLSDMLLKDRPRIRSRLLAMTIALPGVADSASGIVSRIPNFPNFENRNLAEAVSNITGLPCFVRNTAQLYAVGEYMKEGSRPQSFAYIELTGDCGIGAGIILGGQLYTGCCGRAGEIGDMIVDVNGSFFESREPRGALEVNAGLATVYQKVWERLRVGGASGLRELMEKQGTRTLSLSLLEQAAAELDPDVLDILNQATKYWVAAAINIFSVLAPELVVLGGAVTRDHRLIANMMLHHMRNMYYKQVDIKFADRDSDAHLDGAIRMFSQYLYEVVLESVLEER